MSTKKNPSPTNTEGYTLHYRHTLFDNKHDPAIHAGECPSAVVSVECDGSWAAVSVCGPDGDAIAEVTVELYGGKLVARIFDEDNMGGDPTKKAVLCESPTGPLRKL